MQTRQKQSCSIPQKLKHPPEPLSICQATISFSDSVRNLGFYLDKDLSMKEHINFICKTAFLEIRRISTIRHYFPDLSY